MYLISTYDDAFGEYFYNKIKNAIIDDGTCKPVNHYIGGDWMVHYELFIEELEEKVAPIRISQGGQ